MYKTLTYNPVTPNSSHSNLLDYPRWIIKRTALMTSYVSFMPLSPQGHKAGRDPARHWEWDSPQESLQPIMPQEPELLSSSSFGWRGDMTTFSRSAICILPIYLWVPFTYAHFQSIRNMKKLLLQPQCLFGVTTKWQLSQKPVRSEGRTLSAQRSRHIRMSWDFCHEIM